MSLLWPDSLQHVLDEIAFIREQLLLTDEEHFMRDPTLQRAFVRSLEIIGEAVKNVPDEIRAQYPDIEWRSIAGMRDKMIHGYFGVDYEIVWDVVTNKVEALCVQVERILASDVAQED